MADKKPAKKESAKSIEQLRQEMFAAIRSNRDQTSANHQAAKKIQRQIARIKTAENQAKRSQK